MVGWRDPGPSGVIWASAGSGGGRWSTFWPPPKPTAQGHGRARSWPSASRTARSPIIARQLPISEKRVNEDLAGYGVPTPLDLRALARSTVRRGRIAPFQVMVIGDVPVAVRLSQVTAARTAYRIAARAVRGWGAVTIGAVSAQVGTVPGSASTESFVEQVLIDLPAFRWIDRRNGWFWFVGHPNPLLDDLRRILCVAPRIALARLYGAQFRARPGPWPSLEALPRICAEIPGARVSGDELIFDGRLDRSVHLSESENWLVTTLEAAGGTLPSAQLRARMAESGLPRTPIAHLLRCSPLLANSREGLVRLVQFSDDLLPAFQAQRDSRQDHGRQEER